jgi:hypothetical protein
MRRSCRARLKRHNNRRREQRHNKSYEFALGLRCQAAVQLLGAMAEQEEEGGFDPFYTQPGLAAAFQPARFTAHYQPHQFGLAAGFTPAELPPELANIASAALSAEQLQFQPGPLSDFEQQQHFQHGGPQDYEQQQQHFQPAQALASLLDRWPRFDCPAPAGSSPQQSPHDVSGGQQSEGTTATTGQHDSPHDSPSIALAAAVASGTAAAAAAAAGGGGGGGGGGGAVGTPTSRRGGLRRVSANRALEALRALNSTHSTESEWDDESEDGSRSPAPWQQQQQQRRGATRLQAGSRLRAAGGSISTSGAAGPYDLPQDFASHVGHLMPQQQQQQQQQQQLLFEGLPGTQGFNADLPNLHPCSNMQQQQPGQQWGGADYSTGDVQAGWEASLAAHLQDQQQPQHQQQHWGSAYDGSCGGAGTTALTGSGGGASYDQTYVSGPPMPAHLSSAGGCASGPMQQQQAAGLGVQHSAPAGLCYHSRSNSPVISTGGTAPGFPAAAAAAGGGPGPSLLGPAGMRGAAAASQGLAGGPCLSHQWSLPAHQQDFYGTPAGSGEAGGPMQQLQDCELAQQGQHGSAAAAAAAGGPLLPLGAMQQVCQGAEGPAFGSMQPHELQQVLQGLLPPGMGVHSPPEVPMGDSGSTAVAGFPEEGNNPAACGLAVIAAASQGLPAGQHLHGLQHCSPTQPDGLMDSSMQQQQAPADGGMFGSSGGCAEGITSLAGGMLAASSQGMSLSTDQAGRRKLSPQTSMTAAAAAAAAAIVRGGFVAAVARQRGQYSDSAVDCSLHPLLAEQDSNPAATAAAALLSHCEQQQPVQQQQHLAHDLQPCSNSEQQQQPGNSFAAAAGGYVSSSPDTSSAGPAGGMGPAAVCAGLQHLRTDSQGTSVLREELAGVSLGSDHTWQQQMLAPADMHMADAHGGPHAQLQGMQLDAHGTPCMQSGSPTGVEDGGLGMQMQLMAAGAAGCAEQGAAVQERSPGTEFDSADTAAAAATFEAQLAACCGNKDSQEAVFKAWLDALLPNGEQQRQQQQALSASVSLADPGPAYYDLQQQQQQQHLGTDADAHASLGLAAAAGGADVGAGAAAAAAVPLQLAAQRAAQVVQEAGGDGLNPEEDFRELLDLLLDA